MTTMLATNAPARPDLKPTDWHGLYRESWGAEIVPDAFSHPAKYGRGLIRAIYQHLLTRGYIAPGDTIVDPFGGVALGAIDAMRYGLHWQGVELEPRFVELARQNIELWNQRYSAAFPTWGTAQICQGDSRQLARVLHEAGSVVSSPPYAASVNKATNGIDASKFTGRDSGRDFGTGHSDIEKAMKYGETAGQLGAMPEGNHDAVVSSPPFGGSETHTGGLPDSLLFRTDGRPRGINGMPTGKGYGETAGQLGQDTGETFWTAARAIVEQAHAILRPGGVAVWVTGDYVRGGQRVPFGQQWLDLCCAVGFTPVEWIKAWKIEPGPVQLGLLGEDRDMTIERVSFFRRLANQRNPAAAILNEDVIIVQK